jgi:hypothetical protein
MPPPRRTNKSPDSETPWWRRLTESALALGGAVAALAATVFAFIGGLTDAPRETGGDVTQQIDEVLERSEVARIRRDIRVLELRLQALAQPSEGVRLTAEMRALESRLGEVERTSTEVREAILPDATDAVRVPLLQKDVEQLQATSADDIDSVERDIDRQFAFITFIAGTLGIGLLSQVLASRRQRGEAKTSDPKAEDAT